MTNPLIATPQSDTTAITGIGIAESANDLAQGISDGSWVEAGLGGVGVGLEVLSMVIDPIGTVASYGVSWLIEHVQPLKEALDWFAGDPPVIRSFSQTWSNVAAEVARVAEELAAQDAPGWAGAAADTYRGHAAQTADAIAGAATLAEGVGVGVMVMGEVVAAVREIIRDLVAEVVGKLITWALEAVATLGLATPVIVAQATSTIARVCTRISDLVRKLIKTIGNVTPRIRRVLDKLDEIMRKLGTLGRRADGPGTPGTTSPSSAPSAPDAPTVKGPDGTTSPSGTTTPSSTTPSSTTTPSGTTTPSSTTSPDTPSAGGKPGGTGPSGTTSPSGARPADPHRTKTPENSRNVCNDPVDVVTGEVVLSQTDVALEGVLPLVLRRTHVSSYRAGRSFGPSWASTVDQRLEFDDEGVVYVAEDGMLLVYPRPGPEPVMPLVGPRWPLRRTADGFTITRRADGQDLHFAPNRGAAPLSAITDRNGNRINFDRDGEGLVTSVRHSGGYRVDVEVVGRRVAELRLRDTSLVRYRYDGTRNLSEVVNSSGAALSFDYDDAGRMTRWVDRNGQWYRYFYDRNGRCVANQGAGGFLNGTFTYDTAGRTTRFTDASGQATTYRYNALNQVTAEVDPLGHTTTRHWDEHDRLLSETDRLGRTTRYDYDANGDLTTITRPDGLRSRAEHNEFGQATTVVDPDGGVWRQEYDDRGNLVAVTNPAGEVERYGYNARGHRTSITDALGNVSRVEHDAAGLPVTLVDPSGATTRCTWDRLGRIASTTDPVGGVSKYAWSVEGGLSSHERQDGATERWTYDAEGNEIAYVDPMGRVHRREIAHFDLPASETRPDGSRTTYTYDTNLRLLQVSESPDRVWRFAYDAVGNLVEDTDPDGRRLTYRYDAAGQLVEQVNAAGQVVRHEYDALGNITRTHADGAVSEFSYDPMGRVSRATNEDADVRFDRDAMGRVLSEAINGSASRSRYDVLGRRTSLTTPTGRESSWRFDGAGRPVELVTAGRTVAMGFDPAGRELRRTLDGRPIVAQTWDANHRLTGQTVFRTAGDRSAAVVQRRRYRYREDGRVTAIDDRIAGTRNLDVDALGRVTAVHGPGWDERYSYGGPGVTAARWPAPTADAQGVREYAGAAVSSAGGTRFQRDRQGRVVLRQHKPPSSKPASWRFTWSADDRLTGVMTPDGSRWRYRYDPFGRRVAKQRLDADGSVAHEVRFHWDGLHLVEQMQSDGRVVGWDWDPGAFRPLTQVERTREDDREWFDTAFYALVTDLVGTPSELLDETGAVVWRRPTTLWGRTVSRPSAVDVPLRFPGQYHDAETGLHYNLQRYYDPAIAQYYSADPVGAAAGPNPYAYVPDPLHSTDPLGLVPCAQRQIDEYRAQQRVGRRRNVAMARYNVDGRTGRQFGTSSSHTYPGASPMPENPMFNPGRRDADSEWKILEDLVDQLNLNPNSSGRIHIYSERPVCPSCQGVIRQFRAAFPGIELTYSHLGR